MTNGELNEFNGIIYANQIAHTLKNNPTHVLTDVMAGINFDFPILQQAYANASANLNPFQPDYHVYRRRYHYLVLITFTWQTLMQDINKKRDKTRNSICRLWLSEFYTNPNAGEETRRSASLCFYPFPRTPIPNRIKYTLIYIIDRRLAARSSLATLGSSSYSF